jgi:hypothetical protein
MNLFFSFVLLNAFLFHIAFAQFPPPVEDVTILKSRFHADVVISYKEESSPHYTPFHQLTECRHLFARLLLVFALGAVMCTSLPIDHEITLSTHSSGSSNPGKTLSMHRSLSGLMVDQEHLQQLLRWARMDPASSRTIPILRR